LEKSPRGDKSNELRKKGKRRASTLSQIATIAILLKTTFGFILNVSLSIRIRKPFVSNDKKF